MHVVSSSLTGLPDDLYSKVAHYRYKVFVEQLGWQLRTHNNEEIDQFDRPDTVYVVAMDDDENIVGCARLLPTTRPYLLGEVFPQLLNGLPPYNSPNIWELSRFAAIDLNQSKPSASMQFSSPIAVKLLKESIQYAASRGAKRLVTVSPIGVERLLQRAGFDAHRAGPPMIVDGHPLFACMIEVQPNLED